MAYRGRLDEAGRLTKAVIEKIGGFLFGKEEHKDSDLLDQSTDIENAKEYQAIFYHRVLAKQFLCDEARDIADTLERLSISKKREGRKEGVLSMIGGKYPSGERVVQTLENLKRELVD